VFRGLPGSGAFGLVGGYRKGQVPRRQRSTSSGQPKQQQPQDNELCTLIQTFYTIIKTRSLSQKSYDEHREACFTHYSCVEQRFCIRGNSYSTSQKIPRLLCNLKVHYRSQQPVYGPHIETL
jgi:hypothetical protein